MQYYLTINGDQYGPFDLEELKSKKISADTLVWREDFGDAWKKASEVPELSEFITKIPPPPPPITKNVEEQKAAVVPPPSPGSSYIPKVAPEVKAKAGKIAKSVLNETAATTKKAFKASAKIIISIAVFVVVLLLAAFLFKTCASNTGFSDGGNSKIDFGFNKYKQDLQVDVIEVSSNFWGTKVTTTYTIKNNSLNTTYKNINIKCKFFDANQNIIQIVEFMAPSAVGANAEKKFEYENVNYSNLKSVSMEITSAIEDYY